MKTHHSKRNRGVSPSGLFKIEQNVAIPRGGRPGSLKYPFAEMKPGDSFLLNGAPHASVGVSAARFAAQQSPPWPFSVLKTPDGFRCWRVK